MTELIVFPTIAVPADYFCGNVIDVGLLKLQVDSLMTYVLGIAESNQTIRIRVVRG